MTFILIFLGFWGVFGFVALRCGLTDVLDGCIWAIQGSEKYIQF